MIDPLTSDLIIISKREDNVKIYRAAYPQSVTQSNVMEYIGTLNIKNVVGGDISAAGAEIIVKTYTDVYYWCRSPGQSLADAFLKEGLKVPYIPEPQGEAVCWHGNGEGYYTISEEFANIGRAFILLSASDHGCRVRASPAQFKLNQNHPDPFNAGTIIGF